MHILVGASATPARPVIQRFTASDLIQALSRGFDDFSTMPRTYLKFPGAVDPL